MGWQTVKVTLSNFYGVQRVSCKMHITHFHDLHDLKMIETRQGGRLAGFRHLERLAVPCMNIAVIVPELKVQIFTSHICYQNPACVTYIVEMKYWLGPECPYVLGDFCRHPVLANIHPSKIETRDFECM